MPYRGALTLNQRYIISDQNQFQLKKYIFQYFFFNLYIICNVFFLNFAIIKKFIIHDFKLLYSQLIQNFIKENYKVLHFF